MSPRSPHAAVPRLALSVAAAAEAVGVSEDFFRDYIAPEVRWVRRGRLKMVAVTELQRWLDENSERTLRADRR